MKERGKKKKSIRSPHFDPLLIVLQIVCLTSLYYGLSGALHLLLSLALATVPDSGLLLSDIAFSLSSTYGWVALAARLIHLPFMAMSLSLIVEKAKLCWDFVLTLFLFHLFVCTCTYSFPLRLSWWLLEGAYFVVLVFACEFICMRIETKEIKLSMPNILGNGSSKKGYKKDDDASRSSRELKTLKTLD